MLKRPTPKNYHAKKGFTLVELLVVLVIIGGLTALIAPQVLNYLDKAKSDTAKIQIDRLSGVLDLYRLDTGTYPSSNQGLNALLNKPEGVSGWNGPYVKKEDQLLDPWNEIYSYKFPGDHGNFDLFSFGADKTEGGDDENSDITNW